MVQSCPWKLCYHWNRWGRILFPRDVELNLSIQMWTGRGLGRWPAFKAWSPSTIPFSADLSTILPPIRDWVEFSSTVPLVAPVPPFRPVILSKPCFSALTIATSPSFFSRYSRKKSQIWHQSGLIYLISILMRSSSCLSSGSLTTPTASSWTAE